MAFNREQETIPTKEKIKWSAIGGGATWLIAGLPAGAAMAALIFGGSIMYERVKKWRKGSY
jgi:hypothetical protein